VGPVVASRTMEVRATFAAKGTVSDPKAMKAGVDRMPMTHVVSDTLWKWGIKRGRYGNVMIHDGCWRHYCDMLSVIGIIIHGSTLHPSYTWWLPCPPSHKPSNDNENPLTF